MICLFTVSPLSTSQLDVLEVLRDCLRHFDPEILSHFCGFDVQCIPQNCEPICLEFLRLQELAKVITLPFYSLLDLQLHYRQPVPEEVTTYLWHQCEEKYFPSHVLSFRLRSLTFVFQVFLPLIYHFLLSTSHLLQPLLIIFYFKPLSFKSQLL